MKQHKINRNLPHSIVLYDHACVFCRREMAKLKQRDHLQRLHMVDISASDFDPKLWGVDLEAANLELHVLTSRREWLVGIPAVRHVYAQVGLGWMWWPSYLPILDTLTRTGYRWFARHRYQLSQLFALNDDALTMPRHCRCHLHSAGKSQETTA